MLCAVWSLQSRDSEDLEKIVMLTLFLVKI